MTLGDKLKILRQRNDLSAKRVANDLGLAPNAYSHYENDRRIPSIETLCAIADYYHITIDSLWGDGDILTCVQEDLNMTFWNTWASKITPEILKTKNVDFYAAMEDWANLKNELTVIGHLDTMKANLTKQQKDYIIKRINEIIDKHTHNLL